MRVTSYLVKNWPAVFGDSYRNLRREFLNGNIGASVVGIVTEFKKMPYAGGSKHRMSITLYTGYDVITNLVVWPDRDTNKLPNWTNELTIGEWGLFNIAPTIWNDTIGGTIRGFDQFLR